MGTLRPFTFLSFIVVSSIIKTPLKTLMKKGGRNSFMPTMLLAPTLRITWLCNSHQLLLTQCLLSTLRITRLCNLHQLLLTQCLLSALRITPPASPIWSFYSLFFSSYANYRYSHIRSPQTLFFLFPIVKRRRDVSNLFYYILNHMPPWSLMITSQYIVPCPDWHSTSSLRSLHCHWFIFIALWPSTYIIVYVDHMPQI